MSLRWKMVIFIFVIAVFPLVLTSMLVLNHSENIMTKQILKDLDFASSIQEARVQGIIDTNLERVRLVASRTQLRLSLVDYYHTGNEESLKKIRRILLDAKKPIPSFINLSVLNMDGKIIASTDPALENQNHKSDRAFELGLKKEAVFVDWTENKEKRFVLSGPLVLDGEQVGVVMVNESIEEMSQMTTNYNGLGETGEILLAQRNEAGNFVFISPRRFEAEAPHKKVITKEELDVPITRAFLMKRTAFDDVIDYRGKEVLASTRYLSGVDWGLVVKVDKEEAYGAIWRFRMIIWTVCAGMLVFSIMMALIFSRSILKPILNLSEGAERIGRGSLDSRIPVEGSGEIAMLTHTFNRMLDRLKKVMASRDELEKEIQFRKKIESQLKEVRDQALEASRAKSEFLATMSHEIRTPMNAIIGMGEILSETPLNREQSEYVRILRRGADTLLDLINDILDLSKVESGQLKLEETEFEIGDFIDRTMEFMAVRAHQKNLELTYRIHPDLPDLFAGDNHRLRQVLVNLVGNAIKFTEKGEVNVELKENPGKPEDSDPSAVRLLFSVRDSGIGIPKEKQKQIFEPFTQSDSSTTRIHGGTGLGLSICKKLVQLMGGEIWVESDPGKGAVFYFTIKLKRADLKSKRMNSDYAHLKDRSALVVDDNETNRFVLKETLTTWGIQVTESENGKDCLDRLRDAMRKEKQFDLVFLDCRMPGINGFEVAEKAKQFKLPAGTLVIMLTSDHRAGDITKAKEIGLNGYLVKPIKKRELLKTVNVLLGYHAASVSQGKINPQPSLPSSQDQEAKNRRILLVDDSEDNRMLIQTYFGKAPVELDCAENGEEAVKKCTSGTYDAVLMDIHMPVMDGYAATMAIRQWEQAHLDKDINRKKRLKIIALTADALKEDVKKCLDAGCDEHLMKPIKKKTLFEVLDRQLGSSLSMAA